MSTLFSDIDSNCRNNTVCTPMNWFCLKTNRIRVILFKEAVSFCKELVKLSSLEAIPYFIIDVLNLLMPGGNENVTHTLTNLHLKTAGLFKGHTYFNKPAVQSCRFVLSTCDLFVTTRH